MTIWYIGPAGSDTTGDGTSGNPYATVSKCITVGVNGDTVKALTGTYTITSTTNITKQISIISNSGTSSDVIFSANCTIFNVQSSNVSITYVTLQTSNASELVTIDRMSTGATIPTFFTGITISNCNVKYVTNALALNGTFTVNGNAFTRMSGSNVATLIKVYSTRGTCSISSNSFTDAAPVQYIIYLTSTGSGAYLDRCNSKGGNLNINSNTVTFTNIGQVSTFIYQDYFNVYSYGSVGANSQYNINTKLNLNANNNNISYITTGKVVDILINANTSLNMFGVCNINTNTVNNTDYGALHLNKLVNNSTLTINSNDLNRSVFKLYSNILDTQPAEYIYFPFSNTVGEYISTSTTLTVSRGPASYIDSSTDGLRNGKPTTRIVNNGYVFAAESGVVNLFKMLANIKFTIQFYIKITSKGSTNTAFVINGGRTDGMQIYLSNPGTNETVLVVQSLNAMINQSFININTWYHIGIIRNLSTQVIELYLDEVKVAQIACLNTNAINSSGYGITIGTSGYTNTHLDGWLSDFIFIKGVSSTTKLFQ